MNRILRHTILYFLSTAWLVCVTSHAQGSFSVKFQTGSPTPVPGPARGIQQYSESGIIFRSISRGGFIHQTGNISPAPENGGAYLQGDLGSDLWFEFSNHRPFSLVAVDIAEYSTVVPDSLTFTFYGYRLDGSVVTDSFTTDGVIDGTGPIQDFQTFYFSPHFTDVVRVELPTYGWSLDNLVISVVPEPGTVALMVMSCLIFLGWWRRDTKQSSVCMGENAEGGVG